MTRNTFLGKIKATYQTFVTVPNPSAETKSIGLPADVLAVMVFATPSSQLYCDIPNLVHFLVSFILFIINKITKLYNSEK
jgi:hypothetical protein